MKTLRLLSLCLGVGAFLQTANLCEATEEYAREVKLPPLKFSYDDLVNLLRKVDGFVAHANETSSTNIIHSLVIAGPEREVKFRGSLGELNTSRFPDTGYSLSYLFWSSTLEIKQPPISDVTIICNDYYRTVKVKGWNQEQADSLFLLIVDDLEKHSTWLGGSGRRVLFGMCLTLLCIAVGEVLAWRFNFMWYRYIGLAVGLLLIPAFSFIQVELVLPGFAVMSGEASFIRRYSAEIGFYGTIVPLLVTGLLVASRMIREGPMMRENQQQEGKKTRRGKQGKQSPS